MDYNLIFAICVQTNFTLQQAIVWVNFLNFSVKNLCLACPTKCATCTDLDACQTCEPGFGLQSGICDSCPPGTYAFANDCIRKSFIIFLK